MAINPQDLCPCNFCNEQTHFWGIKIILRAFNPANVICVKLQLMPVGAKTKRWAFKMSIIINLQNANRGVLH